MKAIGYVRVSTDQQADRGVSLQAQSERVRAMATVQGADLLDVVVDGGESAKSMRRPGFTLVCSEGKQNVAQNEESRRPEGRRLIPKRSDYTIR